MVLKQDLKELFSNNYKLIALDVDEYLSIAIIYLPIELFVP